MPFKKIPLHIFFSKEMSLDFLKSIYHSNMPTPSSPQKKKKLFSTGLQACWAIGKKDDDKGGVVFQSFAMFQKVYRNNVVCI